MTGKQREVVVHGAWRPRAQAKRQWYRNTVCTVTRPGRARGTREHCHDDPRWMDGMGWAWMGRNGTMEKEEESKRPWMCG